jgi:hypothetical protein
MSTQAQSSAMSVIERLNNAMNAHDLDAFVGCFDTGYDSEQPAHPDRKFKGNEQVRKNWSGIFGGIPDFKSELLRSVVAGDTVWSEWQWHGKRTDNSPFAMRGVIIFGIGNDRIAWGRLYMEPVEISGAGIDAAVKDLSGGKQS